MYNELKKLVSEVYKLKMHHNNEPLKKALQVCENITDKHSENKHVQSILTECRIIERNTNDLNIKESLQIIRKNLI